MVGIDGRNGDLASVQMVSDHYVAVLVSLMVTPTAGAATGGRRGGRSVAKCSPYPDGHSDTDAGSNANTDARAHPNVVANRELDHGARSHRYPDAYIEPDADTHLNFYIYTYADTLPRRRTDFVSI